MKAPPPQAENVTDDHERQLAMKGTDSIYQEVTDRIIKRIEAAPRRKRSISSRARPGSDGAGGKWPGLNSCKPCKR